MIGYVPDQRSRSRYSSASYLTCSRLSDSGGRREKLAGRGKGKERDPVIITFTTLFRPLFARLR